MVANQERATTSYANRSHKFTQQNVDYNRQYCSIYLARLKKAEPILLETIRRKWGDRYPICKLHKLTEENYEKCIVIGTLFKDQKLKPSILKQLAESNQLTPQPILTHFTDESDTLHMEDEVQRYQVLGKLDSKKLVTGIVCALLGKDIGKGKFEVEDYTFTDYRHQIEAPLISESLFILFLSGLDFMNQAKFSMNLQLLYYWVAGLFDNQNGIDVSKLCRIIIAGNSVKTVPQKTKPTISMVSKVTESSESIEAVKSFDQFLAQLCHLVDVDVMPGEYDPSNHILPQQPMHHCMFPKASVYTTYNQVTNPYKFEVEGVKMLGSSGQPVLDIMKFSEISDPLEAMENCLTWNHMAPTAPDTLGCYPYYNDDPFIIEECPFVLFAGNQKEFAYKLSKGTMGQTVCLVSIPQFSKTFQGVLLDLKNLDCKPICFESK